MNLYNIDNGVEKQSPWLSALPHTHSVELLRKAATAQDGDGNYFPFDNFDKISLRSATFYILQNMWANLQQMILVNNFCLECPSH